MENNPVPEGHGKSTSDTFYVSEKIQINRVSVMYKSTYDMVSDFLTKSLQGKIFAKYCDSLLGLEKGDYTSFYTKYKKMKNSIK